MTYRSMKPSYPKEMKDRAKKDGRLLCTVDVPGFCFKGPVDKEDVKELMSMVVKIIAKGGSET